LHRQRIRRLRQHRGCRRREIMPGILTTIRPSPVQAASASAFAGAEPSSEPPDRIALLVPASDARPSSHCCRLRPSQCWLPVEFAPRILELFRRFEVFNPKGWTPQNTDVLKASRTRPCPLDPIYPRERANVDHPAAFLTLLTLEYDCVVSHRRANRCSDTFSSLAATDHDHATKIIINHAQSSPVDFCHFDLNRGQG
jgi:hypothetical protein